MNIQLGVYDPFSAAWRDEYYPLDLPLEWRLDYLANAYRVCVIPWRQLDGAVLECPPGLRAFVAVPCSVMSPTSPGSSWVGCASLVFEPDLDAPPPIEVTHCATPIVDGWRLAYEGRWLVKLAPPAPFELRGLRRRIEALAAEMPDDAEVDLTIAGTPHQLEQIKIMLALMGY
ncbi:MAG: hypothetical protein ACFCUJ_12005 [Thiotrichales bacterium]